MPISATFIESVAENRPQGNRTKLLGELRTYVADQLSRSGRVCLHFICTHNSRRSQLSQAWSHVWAHHFSLPLHAYSSGMEVTEVHANVLKALETDGLQIRRLKTEEGIRYLLEEGKEYLPLYSKRTKGVRTVCPSFAAIMTCSEADTDCPFVPGAAIRIPLWYNDPKEYDHDDKALEGYLVTSRLIAAELYHALKPETHA